MMPRAFWAEIRNAALHKGCKSKNEEWRPPRGHRQHRAQLLQGSGWKATRSFEHVHSREKEREETTGPTGVAATTP
eukprot:8647570-Alexandrium_andersonii.AAC.1